MPKLKSNFHKPEVAILCGGLGTRLATVVADRPKAMALISNRPFLEYQLKFLKVQGVTDVTLLTGFMGSMIEEYFGNGSRFGLGIKYISEASPLGTGGALKAALKSGLGLPLVLLNGDSFVKFSLSDFLQATDANHGVVVTQVPDASRFGAVALDADCRVKRFEEKNAAGGSGFINAGVYFLSPQVKALFPNENRFSLEREVLPKLVAQGDLKAFITRNEFIDIGTPESYREAEVFFSSQEWSM